MNVEILNHVPCYQQQTGRVKVEMIGGLPPLSFKLATGSSFSKIENNTIFSGGGNISVIATDGMGCEMTQTVEIFPALPFVAKFFFDTNTSAGSSWHYYNLITSHDNGIPPILDMWNSIRHPVFLQSRLTGMPAGKYSLSSADLNHCVSHASMVLPEGRPNSCPSLFVCQQRATWHHSFYMRCLRRIASPLLWNTSNWNLCAARAAFDIVRQLHINFDTFGITSVDNGAMFVANLLGEAIDKCIKKFGEKFCDFPWRLIEPYFFENPEAAELFAKRDFDGVFKKLLHLNDTSPADLITVGP